MQTAIAIGVLTFLVTIIFAVMVGRKWGKESKKEDQKIFKEAYESAILTSFLGFLGMAWTISNLPWSSKIVGGMVSCIGGSFYASIIFGLIVMITFISIKEESHG